ncbi:unnamed protein product, partial [Amoebophrya sp. A25]|eukprot:GSA25T00008347001.1
MELLHGIFQARVTENAFTGQDFDSIVFADPGGLWHRQGEANRQIFEMVMLGEVEKRKDNRPYQRRRLVKVFNDGGRAAYLDLRPPSTDPNSQVQQSQSAEQEQRPLFDRFFKNIFLDVFRWGDFVKATQKAMNGTILDIQELSGVHVHRRDHPYL